MSKRRDWLTSKERLDRLFAMYNTLPEAPIDIRLHWVRYLTVRVSGLLETAVSDIFTQYAMDHSRFRIARYMERRFRRPMNLRMSSLLEISSSFGQDWHDEIKLHPDFEKLKGATDSIVDNRNLVAHGEEMSLSHGQLQDYYQSLIQLIDILVDQCHREHPVGKLSRKEREAITGAP